MGGAVLAVLALGGVAVAVLAWDYPTEELAPDRGGPLVLVDRHGLLLARVPAADGRPGRDAWVRLDQVPAIAVATFIVSEDADFFAHGGVDMRGLGRAAWLNLRERRVGYGGSTITMQLVRMLHSRGQDRTLVNKVKEAVLAMRLERALDKRAILEQYVNRAYFGNGAHGIEAAARVYFGKPAASLSAGEATLLAVLPRAPTAYDPLRHLDAALARREHVFAQLAEHGLLSQAEIGRARVQALSPRAHRAPRRAPHFVDWVLRELPPSVRAAGGTVTTTLDLGLQERMEAVAAEHVASLAHRNLDQAGVVVLDTGSGEVRAMVGSAAYGGPNGQINITTWRRHPGSALKPFVYASAIEAGDSPASIAYDIHDVPSAYRVDKLTQPERGPVRYREALAGSYNLAAVHTLEKVGVERMMTALRRAGVGPLAGSADDYGLRLALGSAQVRLLDLASAYGFVARGGRVRRASGVRQVTGWTGATWQPEQPRDTRVYRPADSVARHGHDVRPGSAPPGLRHRAADRPPLPRRLQDRHRPRLRRHRRHRRDPRGYGRRVGRHLRRRPDPGPRRHGRGRPAGPRRPAGGEQRPRPDLARPHPTASSAALSARCPGCAQAPTARTRSWNTSPPATHHVGRATGTAARATASSSAIPPKRSRGRGAPPSAAAGRWPPSLETGGRGHPHWGSQRRQHLLASAGPCAFPQIQNPATKEVAGPPPRCR